MSSKLYGNVLESLLLVGEESLNSTSLLRLAVRFCIEELFKIKFRIVIAEVLSIATAESLGLATVVVVDEALAVRVVGDLVALKKSPVVPAVVKAASLSDHIGSIDRTCYLPAIPPLRPSTLMTQWA